MLGSYHISEVVILGESMLRMRKDKTWPCPPFPFPPPSRHFPSLLWKQSLPTHHIPILKRTAWSWDSSSLRPGGPVCINWLSLGEKHLPRGFETLAYITITWRHTFSFGIWFWCVGPGNWVHLGFDELGAGWFGKLCWPTCTGGLGAIEVQMAPERLQSWQVSLCLEAFQTPN